MEQTTCNKIFISVIITAFKRREFLLEAIKSALNQTLDRRYYEIIVIKDYEDPTIDQFIKKNNIKSLLINSNIGSYLRAGLEEAQGEIVSFLDDDDLFLKNKLKLVYNIFKSKNIVYYHNAFIFINEKGEMINRKAQGVDYNASSISIKKNIVNLYEIEKMYDNPDIFFYLSALESNRKILSGKEKLTYYRYHESSSNTRNMNEKEFNYNKVHKIDKMLDNLYIFQKIFISKKAVSHINWAITNLQIAKYPYNDSIHIENKINYFIHFPMGIRHNVVFFAIYITIKLYPSYFTRYIRSRIFEIQ